MSNSQQIISSETRYGGLYSYLSHMCTPNYWNLERKKNGLEKSGCNDHYNDQPDQDALY